MDRLHSDPSLLICPDFTSEHHCASCAPFVSATVTDAQAAELLRVVWVTTNDDLCVQWHLQVVEDERLQAEQERLAVEEATHFQQAHWLKEETARSDERKKNHFKHMELLMRPHTDTNEDEAFISDFALWKIDKGQFVELYYWTNDGLEETLAPQHS